MTFISADSPKKGRNFALACSTSAITILLVSGCVVSSDETPGEPDEAQSNPSEEANPRPSNQDGEVIASSTTTATTLGSELQVDVYSLERMNSEFLRLRLGVTNNSPEGFNIGFGLAEGDDQLSASYISLIDAENQQRYFSFDQSDGSCFCSSLDGPIASGETETLWVVYPQPPADLENMAVVTPLTPPMLDVPISDSSESIESSNLADAQVLDLTMISDQLEDQTGRTESSDEVSILLSSDVLFETNSSDLSNEAEEMLDQVAQEIDDASAETVSIDGHADNTGNDSVNVPLSKERAESVESALSDLITRQGLSFEVEGHGSADPIADNATEEGRERNRRVSVTFEK
ncbi:OmpA family protein [Nocardiopsis sp. JB363]|uniref:OmpA family protein n=1 Tax=Nocardiopsis sp. JB363 TaxID=1434837 RepID=UPI001F2287DA|nr:OmpA family protein [Nocardiopsis sp. JB363]